MKNLLFDIVEHHKTIYIIHQDFNTYIVTEIKCNFEDPNDYYIEIDETNLLFNANGKIYTKSYKDCKPNMIYIKEKDFCNKVYNYFCKDLRTK